VVEAMGRHAYASPFLACVLAGDLLAQAGSPQQQAQLLPAIATGERIATVALGEANASWDLDDIEATATLAGEHYSLAGEKAFVLDAQNADILLVACRSDQGLSVAVVHSDDLPEGALRPEMLVDATRRSARVRLNGTKVSRDAMFSGADADAALRRIQLLGALLVAAEMCGAAEGAFALTLEYLKTRVQFGRKIGGYQALKHPMAMLRVGIEQSRSLLYHAATRWDTSQQVDEIEIAVRSAKFHCGETCTETVDRAIQFHGAYGFTWECHAQLFFRRAQWAEYTFGDGAHHRRHLASLLLDE
jgi:alkylation response protein AidB-like acyl-CoA dehydrogenase